MTSGNFEKIMIMKFYLLGIVATLFLFSCNDNIPKAILEAYEQLPDDVYALGVTPIGSQAYWHERATPEQLDNLEQVLKALVMDSF